MSQPPLCLPKAFDLRNRVALVTGGSGLLGTQHAAALAEIGANVVIGDIDFKRANCEVLKLRSTFPKVKIQALKLDVSNEQSVLAGLKSVLDEFGAIHVLVNNAAVDPKVTNAGVVESSRLENFSLEQWQLQINVGLTGAFLCAKIYGAWMASNGGGTILNIASDLSVFGPDQRLYGKSGLSKEQQPVKPVTYSVIKTALIGLTRYIATYWHEANVRCNALSPGGIFNGQSDEFVVRLSQLIPLGRMARADEYQAAVQFLCSEASSYMTGQNIVIDGGRSVW